MKSRSFFSRYLRFFTVSLAVILLAELGALAYVDRNMLQESVTGIQVKPVAPSSTSTPQNLKLQLDSGAQNLQVSYRGTYIAFESGDALEILNTTNGKVSKVSMAQGMELSYYKWLYDRNHLILAEKAQGGYYAKLYSLDMDDATVSNGALVPDEILNNSSGSKPREARITLASRSSDVTSIDFSTFTVTTYVKVTGVDSAAVWEFNFPSDPQRYDLYTNQIGNIQCLKNKDTLLYEDQDNGYVYVAGLGHLTVDGNTKLRLLGFDASDNVYLANGSGDTTDTIYYGSLLDEDGFVTLKPKLKSAMLSSPAKLSRMFVTLSGGVYVDDPDNHFVQNMLTGEETSYSGSIVATYAYGFITEKDGYIGQKSLN